MKRCVLILAIMLAMVSGCATGDATWSRTSRSHCFGQPNQPDSRPGFVLFCAESP